MPVCPLSSGCLPRKNGPGQQSALVAFEPADVIAFLPCDDPDGILLRMECVKGDDAPFQAEAAQGFPGDRDLAGLGVDRAGTETDRMGRIINVQGLEIAYCLIRAVFAPGSPLFRSLPSTQIRR